MPGSVTRIVVTPGASVTAGDVLLTLEAMKMEHTLRAPHDGTVREIRVEVGEQVASGTVLVVVDPREQD
jgi:biotin carboxyl carrier protein